MINGTNILRKSFSDYPLKRVFAQGYPLVIKDAVPGYLKDYNIYGNEGGVGDMVTDKNDENYGKYKICIVNSGKNIAYKPERIYNGAYEYLITNIDNRKCVRFIDNKTIKFKEYNFKENTQYTISFDGMIATKSTQNTSSSHLICIFYTDSTVSRLDVSHGQAGKWLNCKITSDYGKTISAIGITVHNYVHYCYVDIDTFQIEEGVSATKYEAYCDPLKYNVYIDNPLTKDIILNCIKDKHIFLKVRNGMNIFTLESAIKPERISTIFTKVQ